jgi:hypothetical protein
MTQKIFDTDNEEDMKLLWNILPDEIYEIRKGYGDSIEDNTFFFKKGHASTFLIKINWHDKTEITRPVNYKDMIGCVGWFWDNQNDKKTLSVLLEYKSLTGFPFITQDGSDFANFTPAKKSELKFYGEDK